MLNDATARKAMPTRVVAAEPKYVLYEGPLGPSTKKVTKRQQ